MFVRSDGFHRPDPTTRLVLEDDVQGVDDAGDVWSAALVF